MSTDMTPADIVREELNSAETELNEEHSTLLIALRTIQGNLKRNEANREALRLTRIFMARRYIDNDEFTVDSATVANAIVERVWPPESDDSDLEIIETPGEAMIAPVALDQEEAQAVFGDEAQPDTPESEPEPLGAEESTPGAEEAMPENRRILLAAAADLGIFQTPRLAEVTGIPRGTIGAHMKALTEAGFIRRASEATAGMNVFFVHRDYDGPLSVELARGEKPPVASEDDISRVRDWVIEQGEANPFTITKIADAINIERDVVRKALDVLAVREIVKSKPMGRFEYVPPTRRRAA